MRSPRCSISPLSHRPIARTLLSPIARSLLSPIASSLDLSSLPSLPLPKKKNTTLIITASLSSFIILIAIVTAARYLFYMIKKANIIKQWEFDYDPHRFSYKELKQATKGFRDRELLGVGGFRKVYKGTFPGSKAEVAVKRGMVVGDRVVVDADEGGRRRGRREEIIDDEDEDLDDKRRIGWRALLLRGILMMRSWL